MICLVLLVLARDVDLVDHYAGKSKNMLDALPFRGPHDYFCASLRPLIRFYFLTAPSLRTHVTAFIAPQRAKLPNPNRATTEGYFVVLRLRQLRG
jgi:hypothetical protein